MVKFKGELHGRVSGKENEDGRAWVSRTANREKGITAELRDKSGNKLTSWIYTPAGSTGPMHIYVDYNGITIIDGEVGKRIADMEIPDNMRRRIERPLRDKVENLAQEKMELIEEHGKLERSSPKGIQTHLVQLIHYRIRKKLEKELGDLGLDIVRDIEADIRLNLPNWELDSLNLEEMTEKTAKEAKEGLDALFS